MDDVVVVVVIVGEDAILLRLLLHPLLILLRAIECWWCIIIFISSLRSILSGDVPDSGVDSSLLIVGNMVRIGEKDEAVGEGVVIAGLYR